MFIEAGVHGEFHNELTGMDVTYVQDDYQGNEPDTGVSESWTVLGNDGKTYYIEPDGYVYNERGDKVGEIDPPAEGDPDRYEDPDDYYGAVETDKIAGPLRNNLWMRKQKEDYSKWPEDLQQRALTTLPEGSLRSHLQEVKSVVDALRQGDEIEALRAANILVQNGFDSNPWSNMNPQDVIDAIRDSLHTGKTAAEGYTIKGKTGGASGVSSGVVVRPDQQSKEDIEAQINGTSGPDEDRFHEMMNRGLDVNFPKNDAPWLNRGGKTAAQKYIVVAKRVTPDHNWLFDSQCAGVASEIGGTTSHAIVVARELNVPCVVGFEGQGDQIKPGDVIQLDGDTGIIEGNGGSGQEIDNTPEQAKTEAYRFVWSKGKYKIDAEKLHSDLVYEMMEEGEIIDSDDVTLGIIYTDGTAEYYAHVSDEEQLIQWLHGQGVKDVKFNPVGLVMGKTAAVESTTIEFPGGVHSGTYMALQQAGLECKITFPDGTTVNPPVDGNPIKAMMVGIKYNRETGERSQANIPITVEADDAAMPQVLEIIHSGGFGPRGRGAKQADAESFQRAVEGELPQWEALARDAVRTLPPEEWPKWVKNQVHDWIHGPPEPVKLPDPTSPMDEAGDLTLPHEWDRDSKWHFAESETVDKENEAPKCPECGSHTYKVFEFNKDGDSEIQCQNCGKHWTTKIYKNYKKGELQKGSPYPENSYENAPDHTPDKQKKKWPKEVNAIYNACMREGNGSGDSKDEKESSCAAIAWAQYKKNKGNPEHSDKDKKSMTEDHEAHVAKLADTNGDPLKAGQWYNMYSTEYKVPDMIRLVEVGPEKIVGHVATDENGEFPIEITSEELAKMGYSFEPGHAHGTFANLSESFLEGNVSEEARKNYTAWYNNTVKEARKNYTPVQQRDLVNENLDGQARNIDKLNLDGTHYASPVATSSGDLDELIDAYFLG